MTIEQMVHKEDYWASSNIFHVQSLETPGHHYCVVSKETAKIKVKNCTKIKGLSKQHCAAIFDIMESQFDWIKDVSKQPSLYETLFNAATSEAYDILGTRIAQNIECVELIYSVHFHLRLELEQIGLKYKNCN